MIFHELGDNGSFEREWTQALSIRPRSPVIQWSCPQCGRAESYPAGSCDVALDGGSGYPDFLGCGAYPLLIVSERVTRAFKSTLGASFVEYPVGIESIAESRLIKETAPPYYRIESTGECRIDIVASGGRLVGLCSRCGGFETEPMVIRRFKLFESSWDGSDLFRDRRLFPRVNFCTERLAEIIRSKGFTNARLDQMA